jgi:hypothetical protein
MSLLTACTIFTSFCKQFQAIHAKKKKWLPFRSVPYTWCPQSALFSSFVNGVSAIPNSNGERASPWNIPLRIWMGHDALLPALSFFLKKKKACVPFLHK